ncbi:MAG TPA: ABC transporter permease [Puia sp.]|nr:ABC transporter permease [Puia sp.]
MFKNHWQLAFRNLAKRKGYSALNILGLTIGITCCLLIFQYVAYERSYDKFPQDASQIVRLRLDAWQKGKLAWQSATVYPAIAPTMKKDFPEVEDYCRLIDANFLLTNDENHTKIKEDKGYFADPSALNMLGVRLQKGNPATALDGPNKIVLSAATAKKYFGNENPLGKRLTVRDGTPLSVEVTGVFDEYPANSHLILHHLLSYATLDQKIALGGDSTRPAETAWGWYDFYAYLKLRPGTDLRQLQSKLPAFCDRYINTEDRKKINVHDDLFLIPLTDIHLYSNYNQEAEVNGNGRAVGFLFMIAFFIILIAWVNYTNLATARSLERAKEVGVRKVLGAARRDLIFQFLTESFLLNFLSLLIALVAAWLLTPSFNRLIGSDADVSFSLPFYYCLGFGGLFLAGAFISGAYPALVLSGYHPITVLKGLFKNSNKGLVLRKGLIVGQFAISVILIAGTILVYQQVQFMRRQQLGVNINQTLVLSGANSLTDSVYKDVFQPFKSALLQMPSIKSVTTSSNVMGQEIYWTNGVSRVGDVGKVNVTMYIMAIDYDFLPSYDLKLVAGRNFSPSYRTDEKAILLNEKATSLFGFNSAQDAIGEKIKRGRDSLTVVGVVTNYHHQGLQKAINPQLILLNPNARNYYSVKLTGDNLPQTIVSIHKDWDRYFPNDPFEYFFLDESFGEQYKADQRFGSVFGMFASLAILIACFGLLGLSAYNVLQRTKEIGIRKVLGASVRQLIFLLSREFLYLVLISLVIAIPLTWWVMHNWLQDFAYRIAIEWWVFALAGALAILVALVTVGTQALKAALDNPVKSLRSE